MLGRIYYHSLRLRSSLRSFTAKTKLFLFERPFLEYYQLGPSNSFVVPIRCDGHGSLEIGKGNIFGYRPAPRIGSGEILLQPRTKQSYVRIGNNNAFSNNVSLISLSKIEIGNDCLIGNGVQIFDSDFHGIRASERRSQGKSSPTIIGDNVWIGSCATILKGVKIGDNSIIGAMSLVTRDVAPNSIVGGNPAHKLRDLPK